MHHSKGSWLAWALCALVAGLSTLGLALILASPSAPRLGPALVVTTLESVTPVVFGVVGALIIAHQPRNTIGWLLMLIALGWTTESVIANYLALQVEATPDATPATLLMVWFSEWNWWLLIGPLLLILLLFPTGQPPSPRWRWVIVALAALFCIFLVLITFGGFLGLGDTDVRLRNPLGIIPDGVMDSFFSVPWTIMMLTTVAFCVAAVFVR